MRKRSDARVLFSRLRVYSISPLPTVAAVCLYIYIYALYIAINDRRGRLIGSRKLFFSIVLCTYRKRAFVISSYGTHDTEMIAVESDTLLFKKKKIMPLRRSLYKNHNQHLSVQQQQRIVDSH